MLQLTATVMHRVCVSVTIETNGFLFLWREEGVLFLLYPSLFNKAPSTALIVTSFGMTLDSEAVEHIPGLGLDR